MTKTLTEQWREGELAGGDYYIKTTGLGIEKIIPNYYEEEIKQFYGLDNFCVAKVIACVPSYDEYNELVQKMHILEKRLAIATKALERIYQPAIGDIYNFETDELDHTKIQDIAYKALKEMEGVK